MQAYIEDAYRDCESKVRELTQNGTIDNTKENLSNLGTIGEKFKQVHQHLEKRDFDVRSQLTPDKSSSLKNDYFNDECNEVVGGELAERYNSSNNVNIH